MKKELLIPLLNRIHGATFATLDSITMKNGIRCVTTGERVIIYRTKGESGYEAKVKRHLAAAGKDPDSFRVGPLPWGERVNDLPLISHNGNYYLQTIQLEPGKKSYFIGETDVSVSPDRLSAFGFKKRFSSKQDLPPDEQVIVNTYNIDHIVKISLMGDTIVDAAFVPPITTNNILKV